MMDAWPVADFDRRLGRAGRVVVLFENASRPASRAVLRALEDADAESLVNFARARLVGAADARRRAYRIVRAPTLVYFEHGEELERSEAPRGGALHADDVASFLEGVHAIQEPEVNERLISRARLLQQRAARAAGPTARRR